MNGNSGIVFFPCPRCGSDLPPTGQICPFCHTEIPEGHRRSIGWSWFLRFLAMPVFGAIALLALEAILVESAWIAVGGVAAAIFGFVKGDDVFLSIFRAFSSNGTLSYQEAMERKNGRVPDQTSRETNATASGGAEPEVASCSSLRLDEPRCRGEGCYGADDCLRFSAFLLERRHATQIGIPDNLCGRGNTLSKKILGPSVSGMLGPK